MIEVVAGLGKSAACAVQHQVKLVIGADYLRAHLLRVRVVADPHAMIGIRFLLPTVAVDFHHLVRVRAWLDDPEADLLFRLSTKDRGLRSIVGGRWSGQ